ncbi:MAG: NADH-quinone oxidoreductase subunit NuoH [bacterium]
MRAFLDSIVARLGIVDPTTVLFVYLVGMVIFCGVVLMLFVAPFAGITSYVERRIAARMQSRVGPNRVGPHGVLQWLADGVKCILKEDLIPDDADKPLFRLAPYLVFIGMFGAFVVLPFGSRLVIADLDVGFFYLLAMSSLVSVGLIMAGWASNNKWSLLGGMRAAAQIVSYEIPAGMAILTVVLFAGSMSVQGVIGAQGWSPHTWVMFQNPFLFAAYFVFFAAALAEGNRTPFDIPEAESELVAGYNTEYSGMRFALFFLAEWANLYVIGAVSAAAFMGGWQVPPGIPEVIRPVAELLTFFAKSLIGVFFAIWIRWTYPRLRVDQMMSVCWKYLVPISFLNVVGTAIWMMIFPQGQIPALAASILMVVLTIAILVLFARKVVANLRAVGGPLSFNPFV